MKLTSCSTAPTQLTSFMSGSHFLLVVRCDGAKIARNPRRAGAKIAANENRPPQRSFANAHGGIIGCFMHNARTQSLPSQLSLFRTPSLWLYSAVPASSARSRLIENTQWKKSLNAFGEWHDNAWTSFQKRLYQITWVSWYCFSAMLFISVFSEGCWKDISACLLVGLLAWMFGCCVLVCACLCASFQQEEVKTCL